VRSLLLLFVVVPLVELYLLVGLSSAIGFWQTVAITLVTGLTGGALAKREGLRVFREWNRALAELRPPAEGVLDGVLVFVGGALLITPGVITDAVGILCLLPPSRRMLSAAIRARLDARIVRLSPTAGYREPPSRPPRVIETTGEPRRDE
jgi:UPF0716 protein FxsA